MLRLRSKEILLINMNDEDAEKKLKAMTPAELVCDASVVYMSAIVDFFNDRIQNFGLLLQIAEEKRKNMEWPMTYKEHTAFVHSCAASLDVIETAASEIQNCCDIMRTVLEEDIHGGKAYTLIGNAMEKSIKAISAAVQEKIDFVHGLGEDDD